MPETYPTEQEVRSNIEAYSASPWGEISEYYDTEKYLSHIHQHENGFVKGVAQAPGEHPYLYVHGINYKDDLSLLVDEEFSGKDAYYTATDKDKIMAAFEGCGNVSYIANIHAAKDVDVSSELKPRLKILPQLLTDIFEENVSDTIALYTHRDTGVFRAVSELDPEKFEVTVVDYDVAKKPKNLNENHKIDYLELLIIKQKKF